MKRKCSGGFSLVEVAIALAVASFCLITISGLLSVGLSSSQTSSQESIMANIAGQVADDLRAAPPASKGVSPFYRIALPAAADSAAILPPIYVTADGKPTADQSTANYSVTVGFFPPPSTATVWATQVRIFVAWPPQAANGSGWPSIYSGSYETMVAINRN